MGSPFQRAFSSKSPLNQHKEVKKLLRQAKRENPQDRSYEKIADLETEFANAKLAHKDNSSKKQDVTIVEKERDNSMADASMSRKGSSALNRSVESLKNLKKDKQKEFSNSGIKDSKDVKKYNKKIGRLNKKIDKKNKPISRKASPLDAKTKYTLDGKPLTKDQTGYDPKQLISDQSMAADKKSKKEHAAEQKKKNQAKPKPKKKPKPINERNQAILDARKAKKNK